MDHRRCLNCRAPNASPYDLMVRSHAHEDIYLCDECHDAIQHEMEEPV